MKKLTLLLAAASIVGVASAVTVKMTTDPVGQYIRLESGEFVLASTQNGTCQTIGEACSYDKTGNEGTNPNMNPDNFTARDSGHWEPAN